MTGHASVGIPRPHTRAPSRTTSHSQLSFGGAPSRPVLIDLTDVARPSNDGETPSKRRKIENDARAVVADLANIRHDGSGDNLWRAPGLGLTTPRRNDHQGQASSQSPRVHFSLAKPNAMEDGAPAESQSLPPLPMRPATLASARHYRQQRMTVYCGASRREGVQVKPYVLDPPPFAPHFERESMAFGKLPDEKEVLTRCGPEVADFFPWMGNHPEDVLSEHVAKQGFYDKTQISHESNTARPSLYSIFKHKSGLHTLSTLFVSALEQRQAHGRVTACSTFKPPPRVTLTDTKREAWLKDLANPAVPLRRLSRTIPHGIRGKVLLDQCMSKDVPTTRAVWLAKCVGANEIRAFKRKGTSATFAMGGEAKWVKDWTACVEQFVDGVIAACGITDWRHKMTYAIRLSANLYSEHLIDREHYLDSVLTSFASANLDTTPTWILVLQIVWKDLVKYRKYGRRLVEALLDKLYVASKSEDSAPFTPIVGRLSELTKLLLNMSPACFIIPRRWAEFEATLKSCLDPQDHSLVARFERLRQRNRRLVEVGRLRKGDLGDSQREQLVRKLDCLRAPFDVPKVSEMCLEMAQDHDTAIAILLRWISTPYREDAAHVYLTVRLLRKWNKLGYDTDKTILNHLATSRNSSGLRKQNVYQVVVEMIRSRHFSVGKYCQWLLARGALSDRGGLHETDPCDVGLLAELPLYSLSEHSVNLRTMLLNGVSFSSEDESTLIQDVKDQIRARCAELFEPLDHRDSDAKRVESIELSSLSWAVKSDISRWLRQIVASRVQTGDFDATSDWNDLSNQKAAWAITVEQFWFIRSILEAFQDYSILADVLNLTLRTNNQETLASIADTVHYHFDIFSAIGAAFDLFERLIERHRSLTTGGPPNKALLVSLIDLGAYFPARSQTIQQLCGQLALCEQKSAVAACSPVSDHIAEALQSAESNFNDEFEHLLTSGTSMDKQTMTRLFGTVVKRIEHGWEHSDDKSCSLGVLCSRLRIFDSKHFDGLMLVWVESLLTSTSRLDLKRTLLPLISAGCLSLRAVVACARTLIEGRKQEGARDKYAQVTVDMLELIAPLDSQSYPMNQATYRFRLEQRRFLTARPLDTVHIISTALKLASTSGDDSIKVQLDSWLSSPRVMSLLRYLVVHDTVAVQSQFFPAAETISQAVASVFKRVIDGLLDPGQENRLAEPCLEEQLKKLIQTVDDFSLPFCQLRLRQLLELEKPTSDNHNDAQTYVVTAIFEGAKRAATSRNITWPILLSVIDDEIAGQVRELAEENLFSSMLGTTASQPHNDDVLSQSKLAGETYLSIVQALAYTITESGAPHIGQVLTEKMSALAQSLQHQPPPTNSHRSSQSAPKQQTQNQQQLEHNCFWLSILLRLTLIHHHPSKSTPPPTTLLLTLSTLLLSPSLRTNPPLLQSLFDTTSTLIDHLPPPARAQCIRALESKSPSRTDPRLRFLFGYGGGTADDDAGSGGSGPGGAGGGNGGEGSNLRIEGKGGKVLGALNLKAWEVIQDPAPAVGENDTFLSLALFRARKVVV